MLVSLVVSANGLSLGAEAELGYVIISGHRAITGSRWAGRVLDAAPEPRNLRRLKNEVRTRWGTVALSDMLKEAVLRTGCLAGVTGTAGRGDLVPEVLAERRYRNAADPDSNGMPGVDKAAVRTAASGPPSPEPELVRMAGPVGGVNSWSSAAHHPRSKRNTRPLSGTTI